VAKIKISLKHLVAHILILSLLGFQFSEMLIYISFKLNQDYIAKNLCIEKDVEGSTCKGCCQLKKKLEKQKDQKEALPVNQTEKLDINLYAETRLVLQDIYPEVNEIKNDFILKYCFRPFKQIFHPPRMNS
jgi:hypothetical protein